MIMKCNHYLFLKHIQMPSLRFLRIGWYRGYGRANENRLSAGTIFWRGKNGNVFLKAIKERRRTEEDGGVRWPTSAGRECISMRNSRPSSLAPLLSENSRVPRVYNYTRTGSERGSIRQVNMCAHSYPARCVLLNSTLLSVSGDAPRIQIAISRW